MVIVWRERRRGISKFASPALGLILLVLVGCTEGAESDSDWRAGGLGGGVTVASTDEDYSRELARFDTVFSASVTDPGNSRQLKHFRDAYSRVRTAYVRPVPDDELVSAAIGGVREQEESAGAALPAEKVVEAALDAMTASLDPHSSYLDPSELKDAEVVTTGQFGGVGIEVTQEDDKIKVVSPIEGTPADAAGLKPGDLITHVDGQPVADMSLPEAVHAMRGEAGTTLVLTLRRGEGRPRDVTVTRAVISIRPVRWEVFDNVGYLRIVSFNERTVEGLLDAMGGIYDRSGGDVRGLILDLRNNPGGLFDQSFHTADAFLDDGVIVSIRGRDSRHIREFRASEGDLAYGLPMVVLVNGGSASASEIVASALQENGRAVVMGTRSFGKGSVQTVMRLPEAGALKLTTALYYSPSGETIQAQGVRPDIVLTGVDDVFSSMREADLPHALPALGEGYRHDQTRVAVTSCPAPDQDEDPELGCAVAFLHAGSLNRFLSTLRAEVAG